MNRAAETLLRITTRVQSFSAIYGGDIPSAIMQLARKPSILGLIGTLIQLPRYTTFKTVCQAAGYSQMDAPASIIMALLHTDLKTKSYEMKLPHGVGDLMRVDSDFTAYFSTEYPIAVVIATSRSYGGTSLAGGSEEEIIASIRSLLLARSRVWKCGSPDAGVFTNDQFPRPRMQTELAPCELQPFIDLRPELFARVKESCENGHVILVGATGTGKTRLAAAVANALDGAILIVKGSMFSQGSLDVAAYQKIFGNLTLIIDDLAPDLVYSLIDFIDTNTDGIRVIVTVMSGNDSPSFPGMRAERIEDIIHVRALENEQAEHLLRSLGTSVDASAEMLDALSANNVPTTAAIVSALRKKLARGIPLNIAVARLKQQQQAASAELPPSSDT